ncbi:MAG: hypothetical protein QG656_1726, partial [Candidatus Hydrogenedentes bacterium]|nr:hypothetical protein [Candidatus Hydrogenedentota bacterium]
EPLPEARNGELPADTVATTEEVLLFFSDAQGNQLIAEPRRIEFTDSTAENCRNALNALIAGPQETGTVWPVVSPGVKVQALYLLEGGELVIDFSRELFEEHKNVQSASFEALLVYGIVQTLTQDAVKGPKDQAVSRVRFLMEGAPPPFPAHLDVSSPIAPDRRWVAAPAV